MTFNNKTETNEKSVYRCKFWTEFGEQCEECLYFDESINGITLHQSSSTSFHNHGYDIDPQIVELQKLIDKEKLIEIYNLKWIFVSELYFLEHVKDYVKRKITWTLEFTYNVKDGSQEIYSCNLRNQNGQNCLAKYKICYTNANVYAIYIGHIEHTHVPTQNILNKAYDESTNSNSDKDTTFEISEQTDEDIPDSCEPPNLLNKFDVFKRYLESNNFENFTIHQFGSEFKYNIICNYINNERQRCGAGVLLCLENTSPYQMTIKRNNIEHEHNDHILNKRMKRCFDVLASCFQKIAKLKHNSNDDSSHWEPSNAVTFPKSITNFKINELNYETEMERLYILGFKIKFIIKMFAKVCELQDTKCPIMDEELQNIINRLQKLDEPFRKRKHYWSRINHKKVMKRAQHENIGWEISETFTNIFEVEDWLSLKKKWIFCWESLQTSGYTHYFKCNDTTITFIPCTARISLSFDCTKDTIVLNQNTNLRSHSCERSNLIWKHDESFTNKKDILDYLNKKSMWRRYRCRKTIAGTASSYKCNKSQDCQVRLLVNFMDTGEAYLYKNNCTHNHLLDTFKILNPSIDIEKLEIEIKNLYNIGLSSRDIELFLINLNIECFVNPKAFIEEVITVKMASSVEKKLEKIYNAYQARIDHSLKILKDCRCPDFEMTENVWVHCESHLSIVGVEEFLTLNPIWTFKHEVEYKDQLQHHFKCKETSNCEMILNIVFYGEYG